MNLSLGTRAKRYVALDRRRRVRSRSRLSNDASRVRARVGFWLIET